MISVPCQKVSIDTELFGFRFEMTAAPIPLVVVEAKLITFQIDLENC